MLKNSIRTITWTMFVILTALLTGCFLDSGSDSTTNDATLVEVKAYDFTLLSNEVHASSLAKSFMLLFPVFTNFFHEASNSLDDVDPNSSPFDLMMCTNAPVGSSIASWLDNDNNAQLSSGDSVVFTLNNCDRDNSGDLISGNMTYSFTNVDVSNLPRTINVLVSMSLTFPSSSGPVNFTGDFGVISQTPDDINHTYTYTAQDISGEIISFSSENVSAKYGCFNVTHTFSIAIPDTYNLVTAAVLIISDNITGYVMSLDDGPPLTFIDDIPYLSLIHI